MLLHPFQAEPEGSLPALAVAAAMAAAVVALGLAVPQRRRTEGERPRRRHRGAASAEPWAGHLAPVETAGRVLGVAALLLCVIAGRLGENSQLDNLAPALVVGAGWPMLVLGSVLVGAVWRYVDPWDGLARLLADRGPQHPEAGAAPESEAQPGVAWALAPAGGWVWYLAAYEGLLEPRSVGLALGVYSIVTVAGCVAFGRRTWLSRVEVFGIVLSWLARLPRREIGGWRPPRHAEALLGALAGGLSFELMRHTVLWTAQSVSPNRLALESAVAAGCTAAGAGIGAALAWWSRRASAGPAVAIALLPLVAGVAVAAALAHNRLTTSLQLMPSLLVDPFGRDPAVPLIVAQPFGGAGLIWIQVGVIAAGAAVGAALAARSVGRPARAAAVVASGVFGAAATFAAASA